MEDLFSAGSIMAAVPFIAIYAIGYLATIFAANIVVRLYLFRDLWQRVISSITVYRLDAAANVAAKGELSSAIGEGIGLNLIVGLAAVGCGIWIATG